MTVLIAVVDDGAVHMAADGVASVHGSHPLATVPGGKIVAFSEPEPLAIGVAGVYRATQEIRYRWEPPDVTAETEPDRALVLILNSLQSHLFDDETLRKMLVTEDDDGAKTIFDGDFLFAFRGRVYVVSSDFCFLELTSQEFAALGSAMDVALGALFVTKGQPVAERLFGALDACAACREEIREPYQFVTVGGDE